MEECENSELDQLVEVVCSACRVMPGKNDLLGCLMDVDEAKERGYFLPDEDDRLRELYGAYLRTRAILLDSIIEIESLLKGLKRSTGVEKLKCFAIGFAAACVLVRSANFIVDIAGDQFLIWKKLDEAEMRYGLERRSFTRVYKNLVSPERMWRFFEAVRYFEKNEESVLSLRGEGLEEILEIIKEERAFIVKSRSAYLKRRLKYRKFSFLRRHHSGYKRVMFQLFRFSGSAIAEMRQPLLAAMKAGKRVTPRVLAKAENGLKPGDVLVTRHDDAMSNLFLPGFWPHAALYIGDETERSRLGLDLNIPAGESLVEAKKDGVRFRKLAETLSVDAFVILRPNLNERAVKAAIEKAVSHVGKRYDFLFDFSVCGELN